ncbi:MAG: GNAT family N-acetyltransferase, partial [Huintestinicola sp.]
KKLFSHNLEFRLTVSPVSPERRLEKMTEKDIDRFKEIYISAFSVSEEHQKVYDFEKYLQPFIYDKDKHAFMLYSGETAVGVVLAIEKPSLSAEPSVYIELCAVDALYQRRGNGTAMLNMFFEKFHENAFITLETYKSRPAYDWYQKMGFVDDDEIRYLVHNPALSLIWNDLQMLRKRNSELTEIKNKLENEDAQNS